MARLQILELPVEHHGDDMVTPFVLVIDQYQPLRYVDVTADGPQSGTINEFAGVAEQVGARAVVTFRETVEIPANDSAASLDQPHGEEHQAIDPSLVALVLESLGVEMTSGGVPLDEVLHKACRELQNSEAARAHLRNERKEARMWARHGYEIGQRHCGWTDHGVAPDWLTEGWPPHFDDCEHMRKAAEYDTALGRVLQVAEDLEALEAHGGAWDANQQAARSIRLAVGQLRDEEATKP